MSMFLLTESIDQAIPEYLLVLNGRESFEIHVHLQQGIRHNSLVQQEIIKASEVIDFIYLKSTITVQ